MDLSEDRAILKLLKFISDWAGCLGCLCLYAVW